MAMTIKFKILEVHPNDNLVVVNFYTDELVTAMQPTWDARAAQLQIENPDWTAQQAMTQAQKEYIPGAVQSVTIYLDPAPTGDALVDYIYSYAPGDWLVTKSKAITAPDTTLHTELDSMQGQEYTKALTAQVAPIAMASQSTAAPSFGPTDFITHTTV